MRTIKFLAVITLTMLFHWSYAQPGTLDQSFTPPVGGEDVWSSYIQSDGKILVGRATSLTRLNYDGTIDPAFIPSGYTGGAVLSISEQSDGKFIVAGAFPLYHGVANQNLIRIEANGAKDHSFTSGIPNTSFQVVYSTAIQPDGRIIIAGEFTTYDGVPVSRIARLNQDGSLDNSFVPGAGPNSIVLSVITQPDGKILIGGYFSEFNNMPARHIARLNQDGSLDMTFNSGHVGMGPGSNLVRDIALQADNKILVGGDFASYNGTTRWNIMRLNANGTLDVTFDPGLGARADYGARGYVYSIAIQPDGKILIGGNFTSYGGSPRARIARIHSGGALDHTFIVGTGASGLIRTVSLQNDGKVIIGGGESFFGAGFNQYNGASVHRLARLLSESPISIAHTTSDFSGYGVSCNGASDGSIDLTIDGGTLPYTFNWNNGSYATQNLADIPAGTYHVVVTDANNSTTEATVVISEPDAIALDLSSPLIFGVNIICHGASTGSISLGVSGGIQPYSFDWDDGTSFNQNRTDLPAGTYSVVVTDFNGCTAEASITLTESSKPFIFVEAMNDTFVFSGANNSYECVDLTAQVTLITNAPYTVEWFQLVGMVSLTSTNVCPTSDTWYVVEATFGSFGCKAYDTVLVKAYNISCGNNNDKIQVCINGSQTVCLTQNAASNVLANNPNALLGACEAYNKQMPGTTGAMDFSIAPNPSSGRFTITLNDESNTASSIRVYDMVGKFVLSIPVTPNAGNFSTELDIATQPDGIYFIQILGEGSVLHAEKVVKVN